MSHNPEDVEDKIKQISEGLEAQFQLRLNQIVQEYFLRPPGRAETTAKGLEELIGLTNSL